MSFNNEKIKYTSLQVITDDNEPEQSLKYQEVWKRVHIRLLTSIRISKLMKNIKQTVRRTPGELNESSNISDILKNHELLISSTSDEIQAQKIPWSIFHPSEGFKIYWNLLIGLTLLYTAIVTPFLLAFIVAHDFDQWFIIDAFTTLVFILDVFITLNTAYIDEEGKMVYERLKIAKNYLKGWLLIDVTACIPFDMIQYLISPNNKRSNYNTLSKLVRLKNLPRLFRLSKILVLFKQGNSLPFLENLYYFFSLSHTGVRLISTISMIILSLHIVSCLWYFMARFYEFGPDTWIYRNNLQDSPMFELYLTSLYWALTTLATIGYGDITPKTTGEIILAMGWMVVAIYFLSFVISSLSSMIAQNDGGKKKILDKKMALLDNYAEENKLSRKIKLKMQNFIKESSEKEFYGFSEKEELLQDLSQSLRKDIALSAQKGAIKLFGFFMEKDERFVCMVVPMMRSENVANGAVMYSAGDIAKEIWFIIRGKAHYFSKKGIKFKVVCSGNYFGDSEAVFGVKRRFTVKLAEESLLWVIDFDVLKYIEKEFAVVFAEMKEQAEKREERVMMDLAEMKAITKAGTNLVEVRRLVKEKYEKMILGRDLGRTRQDQLSKIEIRLDNCKDLMEKNDQKLDIIQEILQKILKAEAKLK